MVVLPSAALFVFLGPLQGTVSEVPDFATQVRPLLAQRCFACHGNDEETREAGLRIDSFEAATEHRDGFPAIVPGNAEDSELMLRVTDEFDPMPPEDVGEPLTAEEIDILRRWIESGAEYAPHWAFVPPVSPAIEAVAGVQPLDALVAQQHAARGLTWSDVADDYTLLRRVSLDLTGLPPSPEDSRAYAASTDPTKFEKAVDRLLASPTYAERWTAVWLDLARYADSSGHGSDPLRTIWRYRDWVIEAFDRNMPFDEFTVQQLAGDLLPDATDSTRLATAFHRNTMTNTEGGTDDEEFRVLAVKDRVNTTMSVWTGLTAGCAECHSHKFDPISHEEYYQLFDIFNQTADTDRNDDRPRLATPTVLEAAVLAERTAALTEAEAQLELHASNSDSAASTQWTPGPLLVRGVDEEEEAVTWELPAEPFPSVLRLELQGEGPVEAAKSPTPSDLSLRRARLGAAPLEATFVRVDLPGEERILSLAEVELIDSDGAVMAGAFAAASQSSTAYEGAAERAIDGLTAGEYSSTSVTHTATETDPWWEGQFASPRAVAGVRIWPRTDGSLEVRTRGFRVALLDADRHELWCSAPAPAPFGSGDHDGDPKTGGSRPAWLDVGPVVGEPLRLDAGQVAPSFALPAVDATSLAEGGAWRLDAAIRPRIGGGDSPERWQISTAYRSEDAKLKALTDERDAAAELVQAVKPTTTPVMVELPADQRRVTNVLTRGNFLQKAQEVNAAVPAAFPPLPDGVEPDRLALARWLVSDSHPLTARVTVNRVWARLFGRGLVRTEGDFGSQGELPTHPRLLDWLSVEFQRSGWDHKALLRTIVSSRTYQQSSNVEGQSAKADPEAVWLSRFPRQRLEAEMVRDTALEVAGLLSRKRFGPSVYPPQPEGLWKAAFNGQRDWTESTGEDRYRRGIYVFLRRTIPYPMLATFDAPSRETCTVRRIPTNTPLQAFVTLNDPVFVEASQGLARRALERSGAADESSAAPEAVVQEMLWCAVSRAPESNQIEVLLSLYGDAREAFAQDPNAAAAFGSSGAEAAAIPAAELAAWTLVASTVLNLDSVLTKE